MLNFNGMFEHNKDGILYGGISLFLFGSSGAMIASEEVTGLVIRALVAVVIPTCGWLFQYYVKKFVTWIETKTKPKE